MSEETSNDFISFSTKTDIDSLHEDTRVAFLSMIEAVAEGMNNTSMINQLLDRQDDYPFDWDCIAYNIKTEAGWECEHCGHPHDAKNGYCLTVHHLDGDKPNVLYDNLVALCQRCHLSIQARFSPTQLFMLSAPEWAVKRGL